MLILNILQRYINKNTNIKKLTQLLDDKEKTMQNIRDILTEDNEKEKNKYGKNK